MAFRKPKEIKELQGTLEASREVPTLQYEVVNENPNPSYKLEGRALEIWNDVCQDLKQVNLLRSRYLYELTNYCKWSAIYEDALQKWEQQPTVIYTNKIGADNEVPSVWFKIMNDSLEKVNEIGRQFGFTASSAERIRLKENKPKKTKLLERIERKVNAS